MRGITLGVEHLTEFLTLPQASGKLGGKRIGYGNCPRYLNNTQFVELAREGWIGCEQNGFALIERVLEANQKGGKIAMLAVIEGTAPVGASHRGRWREPLRH